MIILQMLLIAYIAITVTLIIGDILTFKNLNIIQIIINTIIDVLWPILIIAYITTIPFNRKNTIWKNILNN